MGDSVADLLKTAVELKEEGNKLFKAKEYKQALSRYGKIPLYVAHFDVAIPQPNNDETNPDGTAAEPLPPQQHPVGPGYPDEAQRKSIRDVRVSCALNSVMCYVKLIDADPLLHPSSGDAAKEKELKGLTERALDCAAKALALEHTNRKALFRRGQIKVRSGDLDGGAADLNAAKVGFKADDPEVVRELALLAARQKEAVDKQKRTFSGWLNRVSRVGGGLISDEELKREREREAEEKRARKEWEYKQKESGRGVPWSGGVAGLGAGMQMAMVKLNSALKKEQIEYVVHQWTERFAKNPYEKSIALQFYPLEGSKLLLSLDGDYMDVFKVKDFILSQDETDEFEWQQQKYYPKGKDPKDAPKTTAAATAAATAAPAAAGAGAGPAPATAPANPNPHAATPAAAAPAAAPAPAVATPAAAAPVPAAAAAAPAAAASAVAAAPAAATAAPAAVR